MNEPANRAFFRGAKNDIVAFRSAKGFWKTMTEDRIIERPVPRWLNVWAILMVVATTPLIALGGVVTTKRVGMSDPVWPTTPWYLFFTSWQEPRPGFLIEHTHRLAGWFLGALTIVFAIAMWKKARTSGLRWLGVACLFGCFVRGAEALGNAGDLMPPIGSL